MNKLYPLRFTPILKNVLWGGNKLRTELNKTNASDKCGESWEISDVDEFSSVVANGFLEGNTLNEIVEIYMGDIVGDAVYDKFGNQFPLLIKFIDANDYLSIQVHPNDEMAEEEHGGSGKTEMWYVMDASPESELIVGFNKEVSKEEYINKLENNKIQDILNTEKVKKGDVFFIPAGSIHAIGSGILIAEIQQTSNITYRIFDWNRTDANGNARELNTELALKAIDFKSNSKPKIEYIAKENETVNLVKCPYFTTNFITFEKTIEKDYFAIDSFVVYICLEGSFLVTPADAETVEVKKGESILLPAVLKNIILRPHELSKIMEVYIE